MIIAAAILYAFVGHVLLTLTKQAHDAFSRWVILFCVIFWPLGVTLMFVLELHERAAKEATK